MPKNIRHSAICVNNLEKANFFYQKLLGLKYDSTGREEGDYIESLLGLKVLTWVKLRTDNGDMLELYWMPNNSTESFNHIAFTVDNVQYIRNKLVEYEIVCSPIKTDKTKTHKVMFCKDYDKNMCEIVEELNESKQKKDPDSWIYNSKKRKVRQKNIKQNTKTQSEK